MTSKFDELLELDLTDKVEKRSDGTTELSYVSWSYAWASFKKAYPNATYEIVKFPNSNGDYLPYMYDANTGYMVSTKVTADDLTYEMWLPVMNSNNKAMKSASYTYTTKRGDKTVEQASMFDVNKTIMRCLVKNLAMFGLGLYIYAGEDLPDNITNLTKEEKLEKVKTATNDLRTKIETATTLDELKMLYQTYKTEITANDSLLKLMTTRIADKKSEAA